MSTDRRDEWARFLTRDPLVATTMEPYAYAANNPVNYTNPLGLYPGKGLVEKAKETATDAWDKTGGKVVSAADDAWDAGFERVTNAEWNACLQGGIVVTVGYCHNFVGFRPDGGRAQVGVGFGAGANTNVSGGRYSEETVTASAFWGGGIGGGVDGCGDPVFFSGVGFGGFGLQYSGTPEAIERRVPGIRQLARDVLDWFG